MGQAGVLWEWSTVVRAWSRGGSGSPALVLRSVSADVARGGALWWQRQHHDDSAGARVSWQPLSCPSGWEGLVGRKGSSGSPPCPTQRCWWPRKEEQSFGHPAAAVGGVWQGQEQQQVTIMGPAFGLGPSMGWGWASPGCIQAPNHLPWRQGVPTQLLSFTCSLSPGFSFPNPITTPRSSLEEPSLDWDVSVSRPAPGYLCPWETGSVSWGEWSRKLHSSWVSFSLC